MERRSEQKLRNGLQPFPIKKKMLRQSISETLRNVLKDNLHGTDIASIRNINALVLVSQGYCSQEVMNPSPH